MEKPNKVLIILHPQADVKPMLEHVVSFLKRVNAEVIGYVLMPHISSTIRGALTGHGLDEIEAKARQEASEASQQAAKFFAETSVPIMLEVIDSGATESEALEKVITDKKIDWVIKIAHKETLKGHLHTQDKDLMRHCSVPVWLIRDAQSHLPLTVLGAVDVPSHHGKPESLNQDIVQTTLALASVYETQAELINVYPNMPEEIIRQHDEEAIEDYVSRIRTHQQEPLNELAKKYDLAEEQIHFKQGDAAHEIAKYIESTSDKKSLLVIGTVGRSGISGILYGNTAERVIAQTTCDVIALKPRQ